jgi:hypothetical protein
MTVGEMRARMSGAEMHRWKLYRAKHGPLDLERRYDRPAALNAFMVSTVNGGKGQMRDFMPWPVMPALSEAERFAMELMGNG